MASHVQKVVIDDLDGSAADETVTFGLDGHTYEIDLSADNASELRAALAEFVACARRTSTGSTNGRRRQPASTGNTREIREWATANGYQVGGKGRIPREIVDAYRAAG